MEQLLAFCIVILPIAYGIGCLGRKRKIGFRWAFALSAANVILGLIVTLCSKKPNQFINIDGNEKQKKSSFLIWGYIILVYGWLYFLCGILILLDSVMNSFDTNSFISGLLCTVLSLLMIILGKFLTKDKSQKHDKQKSKVLGIVILSISTILILSAVITALIFIGFNSGNEVRASSNTSILSLHLCGVVFFPLFGAYLIHRAKQREMEENEKSQWNNDLSLRN